MGDRAASIGGLMGFTIGGAIIGFAVLHKICGVSEVTAAVISAAVGVLATALVYVKCTREFRKQDERRHRHGR